MDEPRQATNNEARDRIESIREDIRIPHPSLKFPKGEIVVPWRTIATVDRIALLGGFRVSEVVSKYPRSKRGGNTSDTMTITVTEHNNTGEEVLMIKVTTLKKRSKVTRDVGVPLSSQHEPLAKFILNEWERSGGKPCNIDRYQAWRANREIFRGLSYKVRPQVIYEHDELGKIVKDERGRSKIAREIPEHMKQATDHFLRHIRANELRELQLTAEERVSFFKWSAGGVGMNPMLFTYSMPDWFTYFPKLLKRSYKPQPKPGGKWVFVEE